MKHRLLTLVVLLALCASLVSCEQTPKPKWGNGVPDSYDPAVDGPVWLGPYRFIEPKGLKWGEGISGITFQLQVLDNKVSYFGGGIPPEGAWLSYHTMTYDTPSGTYVDEVKINFENREIAPDWQPPILHIIAHVKGIQSLGGEPFVFRCGYSRETFEAAFPTRNIELLRNDQGPNVCRTFFPVVPGVRTLIDFPSRLLPDAHLFVPEMIELLKNTVKEK